jgi:RHS repeat-associated protein
VQPLDLGYDNADQLLTAPVKNNSTNALIKQYTYGYDTASNRTSETVATTTTTSTPNNVNEITSQTGGVNRTLTYDLNGGITSDGGTRTFEWDGANRLVAINYTGITTRSEFTYDGLNRVAKIVEKSGPTINSTRKFVWHGQEKLEFRDATDALTQRNFAQGQYVGTTAYFYTRDHLGSIREMFTGGGTVVARYDYDPFGRSTTVLGTTPTEFNFTGLYRHSKSNLDLATYRAYDPDLGRWLNRDPIGERGGLNLYGYVSGNPIRLTDPLGLEPPDSWFDENQGTLGTQHGRDVANQAPAIVTNQVIEGAVTILAAVIPIERIVNLIPGVADVMQFGRVPNQIYHTFRHVDEEGLCRESVADAIAAELTRLGNDVPVGTAQAVTVTLEGKTIIAQAYRLDSGVINVGRIVVKP